VSLLHARSLAEDVLVFQNNKVFTGSLQVVNGNILDPLSEFHLTGKSLIHSAPLTTVAFTRSFAGEWGKYIVAIGLLLFAFSTAISWSYYGDRAMTFLFGSGSVIYFRIVYVIGFFIASFIDTTIIWIFSGITIALMTLPNLIGLLLLRKEIKSTIKDYWIDFKKDHPNEKTPE
jgi:AGCS family alanine or glycine:cation symporter